MDPTLADTGAEQHFREYSRGLPCPVSLNGFGRLSALQSLQLRFLVSVRVRRSALEPVLEGVVDILLRTRGGM